jgi:hypothetical protein
MRGARPNFVPFLAPAILLSAFAACDPDEEKLNPEGFAMFDAGVGAPGATAGGSAAGGVTSGITAGLGGTFGGALPDAGNGGAALGGGLNPVACNGLQACSGTCVDTASSPLHCGMCGQACGAGQRCEAGRCAGAVGGATTGGGAITGGAATGGAGGNDGCSDVPAAGLSLSEIAVYQAVKIPIMKSMAPVEPAMRNAGVVQERDAVFRVHVTPGAGWTPRQVSARLDLVSPAGTAPRRFFATSSPSGASSDMDPASAFRIKVPAEAIAADTTYSVTLVECTNNAQAAAASAARFPADGFAPLGAVKTGPLRIQLIPVVAGGRMPDVSEAAVETYRKRLLALYPVTKVEMEVAAPLTSSATSMCAHLSAVTARRTADNAPIDVYYYGLTNGTSGGQSGCSNANPTASSRSKVSMGWASSGGRIETGAATMCHELGHSHGRLHAPCQVSDPDRSYPNTNADIGVWGYDARSDTFLPPTRKDMMSYCPNPDRTQAWISDYTYRGILARVAAVNALATPQAFIYSPSAPKVSWRTLVHDSVGTHWGEYPLSLHGTPEGLPLPAIIHGRDGPIQTTEVYKEELEDGVSDGAYLLTIPQPAADWVAIEVPGLLAPQPF